MDVLIVVLIGMVSYLGVSWLRGIASCGTILVVSLEILRSGERSVMGESEILFVKLELG